jgi:hypothetical protein
MSQEHDHRIRVLLQHESEQGLSSRILMLPHSKAYLDITRMKRPWFCLLDLSITT